MFVPGKHLMGKFLEKVLIPSSGRIRIFPEVIHDPLEPFGNFIQKSGLCHGLQYLRG
jgi:hypothetical protein